MASTASEQSDWRWCSKCAGLVYFGSAACPAGGVHDHSQSGDYFLRFNGGPGQSNWRWCKKCQSLSFTGNGAAGPCPNGGSHDTSGSYDYTLTLDQDGAQGQSNWRWCNKCQGLFWAGGSSLGECQAGGYHDDSGSGNYTLTLNGSPSDGQDQWRWCSKCMMLCYDGYATCTAGGAHINVASGYYNLTLNDPSASGEDNWRWCNKCYGIAYAGGTSPGSCPATGVHDHTGSGNYVLRQGSYAGAQSNWSRCSKCQLLWYSGNGKARCPSGPNSYHDNSSLADYAVEYQPASSLTANSSTSSTITPAVTSLTGDSKPSGSSLTAQTPKAESDGSISTSAIAGIAVGAVIAFLITVGIVLLWWYRRRREQRASAQAGEGQQPDHSIDRNGQPEVSIAKTPLANVLSAKISEAPGGATTARSNPVELDGQPRYEI